MINNLYEIKNEENQENEIIKLLKAYENANPCEKPELINELLEKNIVSYINDDKNNIDEKAIEEYIRFLSKRYESEYQNRIFLCAKALALKLLELHSNQRCIPHIINFLIDIADIIKKNHKDCKKNNVGIPEELKFSIYLYIQAIFLKRNINDNDSAVDEDKIWNKIEIAHDIYFSRKIYEIIKQYQIKIIINDITKNENHEKFINDKKYINLRKIFHNGGLIQFLYQTCFDLVKADLKKFESEILNDNAIEFLKKK